MYLLFLIFECLYDGRDSIERPVCSLFEVIEEDVLLSLNHTGSKILALFCKEGLSNKACQLTRARVPIYLQKIEILEKGEDSMFHRTIEDDSLLNYYNRQKRVKMINFFETEELCLVFDDEILILRVKQDQISKHYRIMLRSTYKESMFLGAYKNAYLFSKPLVNMKDFLIKERSVECINKDKICELIDETENDTQVFDTTSRLQDRSIILMSEENRDGGGCLESDRAVEDSHGKGWVSDHSD